MDDESTVDSVSVLLVSAGRPNIPAVFSWDGAIIECTMTLQYADTHLVRAESDYFEALCSLRRELEIIGLLPYCYGASRNCFPSGMSRSMADGMVLHKMQLGRYTKQSENVTLFASGPDVEPVTVAEQAAFYRQWLESAKI